MPICYASHQRRPQMNRAEFNQLRQLPDKRIDQNIEFRPTRGVSPNLVFEQVSVHNGLGWDVILNGTYKPDIPSVTFNFYLRGTGPICRLCVNGVVHREAGRTHKHDLRKDDDPRLNLPTAIARPDIDIGGQSVDDIWRKLCAEANIIHAGSLICPGG
jgi:hypothetical protein